MPTTSGDNLRYPLLSDTPNVPRDLQFLAEDVQAALNTAPRRGSAVSASFTTDAAVGIAGPTGGWVVPTADGSGVGLTFIAPPSGRVSVTVEGNIQTGGQTQAHFLSYFMKTGATIGSGTTFLSPIGARSAINGPNAALAAGERSWAKSSQTSLITGLTAGSTYNVYFVSTNEESATLNVSFRRLTVIPILL